MKKKMFKLTPCKLCLFIASTFTLPILAAIKPISCSTNFKEKSFTIEDNSIAFHNHEDNGRSISSVMTSTMRRTHKGFKKTLYKDGQKHFISIKNLNNFDSSEDFLSITSPKGHKMTFPINCQYIN